jgi:hypothetical protein
MFIPIPATLNYDVTKAFDLEIFNDLFGFEYQQIRSMGTHALGVVDIKKNANATLSGEEVYFENVNFESNITRFDNDLNGELYHYNNGL